MAMMSEPPSVPSVLNVGPGPRTTYGTRSPKLRRPRTTQSTAPTTRVRIWRDIGRHTSFHSNAGWFSRSDRLPRYQPTGYQTSRYQPLRYQPRVHHQVAAGGPAWPASARPAFPATGRPAAPDA